MGLGGPHGDGAQVPLLEDAAHLFLARRTQLLPLPFLQAVETPA